MTYRSQHRHAGCLVCKPRKPVGNSRNGVKHAVKKRLEAAREEHSAAESAAFTDEIIEELLDGARAGAEELDRDLSDVFELPRNGLLLRDQG